MNVATIKLFCWLTSIGLTFALSFFAYDFYRKARDLHPFDRTYAEKILKDGIQSPPQRGNEGIRYDDVLRTMHQMNWTGVREVETPVMDPSALEPQKPVHTPVDKILKLLMIQVDAMRPERSRIYVRFLEPAFAQRPFRHVEQGATLPEPHSDITVSEIRADAVVFTFANADIPDQTIKPSKLRDRPYIVEVGPDGVRAPIRREIPESSRTLVFAPTQTTLVRKGVYQVGSEDSQYIAEHYPEILTRDLEYRTYRDPQTGKRAGIEVRSVRAGSVAARHGAQSGDIIVSVNGHPVTSDHEAIKFAKDNADKFSTWNVEIIRLGRRMTLTFESPE